MKLNKIAIFSLIVSTAITFASLLQISPVSANAVTLTVTSPSNSSFTGSTAQEVSFNFVASREFIVGDTINIFVSPTLSASLSNCTTSTTAIGGGNGTFGSLTSSSAIFTFTSASTSATTASTFCLNFPAGLTTSNYVVTFTSTNTDFGVTILYVGDDNDVLVTANVGLQLSFNIRNQSDTSDSNACQIGTVNTINTASATSANKSEAPGAQECAFSLALGTSAQGGMSVTIQANDQMSNGTYQIAQITNGEAFTAGEEDYGVVEVFPATTGFNGTTSYNLPLTLGNNAGFQYSTNDGTSTGTPIPSIADGNTAQTIVSFNAPISYTAGTDNSDVTVIYLGMNAGSATAAGVYSQTQTFYATPNF